MRNDLTGRTFDFLNVVCRSDDVGNGKKPVVKWKCECECGNVVDVKSDALLSGHTKSCGCKKIKHGHANKERLYETWKNMRRRCFDPSNKRWDRYGGRGITVCEDWLEYTVFREWAMNNGYTDELTIDRIDSNGNYCPENCQWVSMKVQANNVSRNRIIEHNGIKLTMAEFAEKIGLSYSALQHRLDRGWKINDIVNTPQRSY